MELIYKVAYQDVFLGIPRGRIFKDLGSATEFILYRATSPHLYNNFVLDVGYFDKDGNFITSVPHYLEPQDDSQ